MRCSKLRLIALLGMATLAVLIFVSLRTTRDWPEVAPPVVVPNAGSPTAISGGPETDRIEPVGTVPFSEGSFVRVKFVDLVSSTPLAGLQIVGWSEAHQTIITTKSDLGGEIVVPSVDRSRIVEWGFEFIQEKSRAEVRHAVGTWSGSNPELVVVPAFAALDCSAVDMPLDGAAGAWALIATTLPEIPGDIAGSSEAASLRLLRDHDPHLFHDRLRERGRTEGILNLESAPAPGSRRVEFLLPFSGIMQVTVRSDEFVAIPVVSAVTQGQRTNCSVRSMPFPWVSGRVEIPNGDVKGLRVSVMCQSVFTDGEPVPRGRNMKQASSLWGPPNSRDVHVKYKLSTMTDEEGRFRLRMPFTGNVAAWTPLDSPGPWYSDRKRSPGRFDDVDSLVLTPVTSGREARMRAVDGRGNPLARAELTVFEADTVFGLPHPRRISDGDGWFSIEDLGDGLGFTLTVVAEGRQMRVVAESKDGATVVFGAL